jgi:hypothetical protein
MPFDQHVPRALTPTSIRNFAPIASGVYGVSNAREWIYIGETDDIRAALIAHLADYGTSVMIRKPTGFVFEVCERAHRSARQDRLILEYEPACNRQWSGRS